MREFAIFTVGYENASNFIEDVKHEDINTLRLNVKEYDAIVKLYTHLLSATRSFEYEQWLEGNSDLTIALKVEDAMTTLSALYNCLKNTNLHLKVYRAIERITREMSTSKVEYH